MDGRAMILGRRLRMGWALLLYFITVPIVLGQQSETAASLQGTVRDARGSALADVEVRLESGNPARIVTARTDSTGKYRFAELAVGVYALSASAGSQRARISSLFLAAKEKKTADLTLAAAKSAETSAQFFDEPQYTVAGVTDTTSLGGHGSDTVVRTRTDIAKDTAALGKPAGADLADAAATEKLLQERLKREPDQAELHHQLADVEEKVGNPLEAVRQYQRAAELNPSEPYIFDWGSELLLHHAPEPAIEVFTKGNQLFPKSTRMLIGLGAAQFAHGSNDLAVRDIGAASDLNPDDPAPYLFLGKILLADNAPPAEVVEKLRRFAERQPQNPEANYYYAVALWKQAKNAPDIARAAEIESLLKRAVSVDAKCSPAYLQLGIVHSARNDNAEAIGDFQRAIQADPQSEQAHFRLAQAYRQAGEAEKSTEEIRAYEQLNQASERQAERERHEIRQFVYTLRDKPMPSDR